MRLGFQHPDSDDRSDDDDPETRLDDGLAGGTGVGFGAGRLPLHHLRRAGPWGCHRDQRFRPGRGHHGLVFRGSGIRLHPRGRRLAHQLRRARLYPDASQRDQRRRPGGGPCRERHGRLRELRAQRRRLDYHVLRARQLGHGVVRDQLGRAGRGVQRLIRLHPRHRRLIHLFQRVRQHLDAGRGDQRRRPGVGELHRHHLEAAHLQHPRLRAQRRRLDYHLRRARRHQ